MTKDVIMDAYTVISKIEDLFSQAEDHFNMIPNNIQESIFNYHNSPGTLQHSLFWGLRAAKELREDWHTVVAEIPCGE
jgi:hypothetical protein